MKLAMETRYQQKYEIKQANTERMKKSAVIHMQHLLNEDHKESENRITQILTFSNSDYCSSDF